MKKLIRKWLAALRNLHNTDHLDRMIFYRISSVDEENQTILIHVVHKNIFIKQTFSQVVSSPEIIEGLSCEQACWLGVYYGKAIRSALQGRGNFKNIKKPSYLLKHRYGRYRIHSENRDGTISCVHLKTRKELTLSPLSIAKDILFIKEFDANQACYIGILAGIQMNKNENNLGKEVKQKTIPYLRVVK